MSNSYKQLLVHTTTADRIDKHKIIPTESYDSVINRILDEVQ